MSLSKRKLPLGPSSADMGLATNEAGKGDGPRSCHSNNFKDNFGEIDWGHDAPQTAPGRKFVKTYTTGNHTVPLPGVEHQPAPEGDGPLEEARDLIITIGTTGVERTDVIRRANEWLTKYFPAYA